MAVIPLGERPPEPQKIAGLAPFALGFRPFFTVAALSGVVLLGLWLAIWSGQLSPPAYYGMIGWHAHEMLFGYSVAVISGFLLTAVRNWTGIDTITGKPLAALSLLWLLGRLAPFFGFLPAPLIALLDLAFLPLLIAALYAPLMQAQNHVNRIFMPLLGVMALANLLVHLQALNLQPSADQGMDLMLNMVLLLLALVSGRVLPFFTEQAVPGSAPIQHKRREQWVFGTLIGWTLLQLLYPQPWLLLLLAVAVALSQGWRLWHWYHPHIWRIPILWVLFCGMGWFVIGFMLKGLAVMGWFADSLATHALTSGVIGVMTLGMMARVALGHTGRDLKPARLVEIGFILLNLAVALRVFAPVIMPESYSLWINASGGLWILCFGLFSLYYLPILLKPRIDGRPG